MKMPCSNCAEMRERRVLAHRHAEHEPLRLAVLGDQGDPGGDRAARRAHHDALAVDEDLALGRHVGAGDRAHDLGAARADQPGKSHDLAGMHLKRDVVDAHGARRAHAAHVERHRRVGRDRRQIREVVFQRATHHQADQIVGRHLRHRARLDRLAVAQHGHAVGDARQLLEPVRDVDERDALRLELRDEREQRGDLAVGQRRGRLVHHDQPRLAHQALRDLGELLLGDRQPARLAGRAAARSPVRRAPSRLRRRRPAGRGRCRAAARRRARCSRSRRDRGRG